MNFQERSFAPNIRIIFLAIAILMANHRNFPNVLELFSRMLQNVSYCFTTLYNNSAVCHFSVLLKIIGFSGIILISLFIFVLTVVKL